MRRFLAGDLLLMRVLFARIQDVKYHWEIDVAHRKQENVVVNLLTTKNPT